MTSHPYHTQATERSVEAEISESGAKSKSLGVVSVVAMLAFAGFRVIDLMYNEAAVWDCTHCQHLSRTFSSCHRYQNRLGRGLTSC